MNWWITFDTALAALSVNRFRTALTSLGITIGIAAVITLVAAGQGAQSRVDDLLGSIGPNLVVAMAGSKTRSGLTVGSDAVFTREDAAAIRRELKPLINGCSEISQSPTIVSNETGSYFTAFAGGVAEVKRIRRWEVAAGRFYDESEDKRQSKVAVLGKTVAEKLFPNTPASKIVGKTIRAGDHRFEIIGVLAGKGTNLIGADQDDIIMVPISTLLRKIKGSDKCQLITVEARTTALVPKVKEEVERLLFARHGVRPGREATFRVNSIREMAAIADTVTRTLSILVFSIALVSLFVGGIGVMNIMLASVTERTREIGIRMAVGARTRDVMRQFLTEAVILALLGGLVGIAIGSAGAYGIAIVAKWRFEISPSSVIAAVLSSAGVGVFFGWVPASRAANLDPIEALRYE